MLPMQDLKYAIRAWIRDPGFAALAVTVLALGIGLVVAGFGVVNAYLVRPLPFPEPDRLYRVMMAPEGADFSIIPDGLFELDWGEADRVAEAVGKWDLDAFSLLGDQGPEQVRGSWVSPGLFSILGQPAALGRLLTAADTEGGGASVAVISHGLWMRRFGGAPDVLGRRVRTFSSDRPEDAELFTIVGVLPKGFWHLNDFTDVMVPLRADRVPYLLRLRPGVTAEEAALHLTRVATSQLGRVDPEWRFELRPAREEYVATARPTLMLILASVALVLLVACGNVAVLLLIRANRRGRELTILRALGAARWRLASQSVLEALILTLAGALVGVGLAAVALHTYGPLIETRLGLRVPGGADAFRVDLRVAAVAVGAALATGLAFGLLPLATAGRRAIMALLGGSSRGGTETRSRRRSRSVLMAAEVALTLGLLITAGLLARSALHVHTVDLGFEPASVMVAELQIRARSYPEPEQRLAFVESVRERLAALPGVASVAASGAVPFSTRFGPTRLETEEGTTAEALPQLVGSTYEQTLRIPRIEGRWLRDDEAETAVVSQRLAERLWPGADPVGRRLRPEAQAGAADAAGVDGADDPWYTVVGVVADVRKTFTGDDLPDFYVPLAASPPRSPDFALRAESGDPLRFLPALRSIVRDLDATVPVADAAALSTLVSEGRAGSRFLATLLGAFAAITLLLAAVGLYGVIAYAARQRRRDVAIRVALGATSRDVTRAFLVDGAVIVGAGTVAGLGAGAALARLLGSQLHGITVSDVPTYAGVTLGLVLVALLAVWLPARGAASADTAAVLREE